MASWPIAVGAVARPYILVGAYTVEEVTHPVPAKKQRESRKGLG